MRLLGAAFVVVVVALSLFVADARHNKRPDQLDYDALNLAPDRLAAARLIPALHGDARAWKPDAAWWAIELVGVRADGAIDLGAGGRARVVFLSPSRVQTRDPKRRRDAMRRYVFGRHQVRANRRIGVRARWKSVFLPPVPRCSVGRLIRALRTLGLRPGRQVDVSFDPKHAYAADAPAELSWRVRSRHRPLNGWFSMTDCRMVRVIASGRS